MKDFKIDKLFIETIKYFEGDIKRIQHFTKVHSYAFLIGRLEGLSEQEQLTLETAAVVHDIGIKNAERKYGSCGGKLQEKEGPPEACRLLTELGYDDKTVNRVCFLVGNHHTYDKIDGMDFQILCEADLIVNLCEENTSAADAVNAFEKVFKTDSGIRLCREVFNIKNI